MSRPQALTDLLPPESSTAGEPAGLEPAPAPPADPAAGSACASGKG